MHIELNDIEFFKHQKELNLSNWSEINKFYDAVCTENTPVFFHAYPKYNSLINAHDYKYLILHINEDEIFVPYKMINILGTQQVRLIDPPVSINNNSQNVENVIDNFKKLSFVKIAFKDKLKTTNLTSSEKLITYNDYYYEYDLHNYDSSQFRSKFGINKLLKDEKFDIIISHFINFTDIKNLRFAWIEDMERAGHIVNRGSERDFIRIIESNDIDIVILLMKYDNVPVNIQVFLNTPYNYTYRLYVNHLGRRKQQVRDNHNQFLLYSHMDNIQNYFAKKILKEKYGLSRVYLAGCRPTEKRLLKHKETFSDGVITYSIDNCNYVNTQHKKELAHKLF